MVKSILIPLDNSPYSEGAKRYGFDIARRHGSTVSGIGIVDVEDIDREGVGAGLGSSYYSERLTTTLLADAEEKMQKVLDDFENACKRENIACSEIIRHSVPAWAIAEDANYHDLIIMGLKSYFHFETTDRPGNTLQKVARRGVKPLLAVPPLFRNVERVVALMDGEGRDSRTLSTFVYLDPFDTKEITLLHVSARNDEAMDRGTWILNSFEKYLEPHGKEVRKRLLIGDAPHAVLDYMEKEKPDLMVSGFTVKKGLKSLFFGSLTDRLIARDSTPLFLYR